MVQTESSTSVAAIGAERVGVRISPAIDQLEAIDSDPLGYRLGSQL